jgi:hypothetical protein
LKEDNLDRILERSGIYQNMQKKRKEILTTISLLFRALEVYHGEYYADPEIIAKLIWDVVRIDPFVIKVLIENDRFDLRELEGYGGVISRRIVIRMLQMAKGEGILK